MPSLHIQNARVIDPAAKRDAVGDVFIRDGLFVDSLNAAEKKRAKKIDATGLVACPGLVDVHVHFREPGPDGPDSDTYTTISRNYVPEAAVKKPENAHYQAWVHSGHLIATPGNMIDLEQIQEELIEDASQVHIREVAKDPWGGHQLGANLAAEGFTVVDIPQQVRYLSDPMKEIAAVVDAGRFHHDGNPAYVWMLSNVEVQEDRNENIFPRKSRASNKIDAAVATIVAMNRALAAEPAPAAGMELIIL